MFNYDKLFHYLQPTDDMERISKTDFLGNMEALFESLDKENKGIIIVDEDKDNLVICPARWFNFCFDDDFGCIINSALRYSIDRQTYMPEVVVRFMRKYIAALDGRTLAVAIRDIDNALTNSRVQNTEMWKEIKKDLTARLKEIEQRAIK